MRGLRLTRGRGVPRAGEALYWAGPVTRTRQVAAVTRSMMVVPASAGGVLSAGGGSNSTLANALLTAQLMFCGIVSVARMNAGADAVATTTPTTSPSSLTSGPPQFPGCIGTLICKKLASPCKPDNALTVPFVYFGSVPSKSGVG